jgi:hypothetical protein
MVRELYAATDFEFALVYVGDSNVFYVFPVEVFISYGSGIHLVETGKRQRKPRSADYRDAWNLISQWAAREETRMRTPVKFGEAAGGVIPSQAPMSSEKV